MRILQIVDSMNLGGIQVAIMNVYREMVKEGIQFDFIVFKSGEHFFSKEIKKLGGRIYYIPSRRDNYLKFWINLYRFYKNHKEYDIVHYHASSLTFIEPLTIAKITGIRKRIIHSHSTNADGHRLHYCLHKLNKKIIKYIATDFVACGGAAANWMYSNHIDKDNINIILNGINIDKYAYNENQRQKIRSKLGIDGLVLAHVGRFNTVKNHKFIIDVLHVIKKLIRNKPVFLILIGDGPLKISIEKKVQRLNLVGNVLFLGQRNDVAQLLQAADVFLLPSLFEGFPVSSIEAECIGIPCFLSDVITKEVAFKNNVFYLSLNDPIIWAEKILDNLNTERSQEQLKGSDVDIKQTMKKWKSLYLKG